MDTYQTLAHNLAAASMPDASLDMIVDGLSLRPDSKAYQITSQMLDGPFGKVELPCECKAFEGYVTAFDQVLELFENQAIGGDRSTVGAVLADRDALAKLIRALKDTVIEVVNEPEPEVGAAEDFIADFKKMMASLGFEVVDLR